jgi:hypothetical protein
MLRRAGHRLSARAAMIAPVIVVADDQHSGACRSPLCLPGRPWRAGARAKREPWCKGLTRRGPLRGPLRVSFVCHALCGKGRRHTKSLPGRSRRRGWCKRKPRAGRATRAWGDFHERATMRRFHRRIARRGTARLEPTLDRGGEGWTGTLTEPGRPADAGRGTWRKRRPRARRALAGLGGRKDPALRLGSRRNKPWARICKQIRARNLLRHAAGPDRSSLHSKALFE